MKKNLHRILGIVTCMSIFMTADAQPKITKMPRGVKATDVSRHQIKPAHVLNVSSDDDTFEDLSAVVKLKVKNFDPNRPVKCNWNEFMDELHKALKDSAHIFYRSTRMVHPLVT